MAIEQHNDVESGEANGVQHLQEPFIAKEVESDKGVENGSIGMVLLSTFVAVCGSFSFGTCVSIFNLSKIYNLRNKQSENTLHYMSTLLFCFLD